MVDSADQARKVATQRYQDKFIPSGTITDSTTSGVDYKDGLNITNQYARTLYDMSIPDRKTIAQSLKNAGYKVSATGGYSRKLVSAYSSAIQLAQFDATDLGQKFDDKFFAGFLVREAAERIAQGGGAGSKTPEPYVQKTISTKTQIRDVANEIARDLIGRGLSEEQFNKYYKLATEREKTMPTKTTYKKLKGGGTEATTTGGPDTKEFLYQQIAGTDEAKQNKIFSFYDAFKSAIGVQ